MKEQKYIIERVQENDFWAEASILDMDSVREALRDLIKFIEKTEHIIYYPNFADEFLDVKEGTAIYTANDLQNYKEKVEYYLKEHRDNMTVYKLRQNKILNTNDMDELERVLWQELGTKDDYRKEYGDTPIGHLVRKIVGVDREAVNEAFSEFLSEEKLNVNQIRFVKLMVDYIVKNGNIEDRKVLMQEPFKSAGSIIALFKDDMTVAQRLLDRADEILRNSEVTA